MGVKERLIEYAKYKGISRRKFAAKIGASPAFIGNISKGIGVDYLNRISIQFPDLNISWLIHDDGDMLLPTSTAEPQTHLNNMDNFTQLLQAIIRHGEEISEHRRLLDRAMSIVEQQQAERMPATSGVLATAVRDSQNPPPLRNESK